MHKQEYNNRGELVPDELITAMVEERLKQPDVSNGYILDGFPRTLVQAQELDKVIWLQSLSTVLIWP